MKASGLKAPIELARFCGDENCRYAVTAPWVADGWRYATDLSIGVRVPAPDQPNTPPFALPFGKEKRWPPMAEIFEKFPSCRRRLPDLLFNQICGDCLGTGRMAQECLDCRGAGHNCPDGVTGGQSLNRCPMCQGKGLVPDIHGLKCRFCFATGSIPSNTLIGRRLLAGRYLSLIANLPDLRIRIAGGAHSNMAFVSRELQGALMPLARD